MGTNPTKAADNIYCKCRKEAAKYNDRLHSREGAAELLGYSPSSLAGWELGTDRPSPEAVMLMSDLYHAPELRNHYCRHECSLGGDTPELSICELDRITVRAMSSLRKISKVREDLLDITEDGTITEEEKPALEEIIKSLDELSAVAQSLKAWSEKNL